MIVLDASALLALLFCEEGHQQVAEHLERSCCSWVNLAEVLTRFERLGQDSQVVLSRLERTTVEFVPFDRQDAARVATLEARTRALGLSLADRACLALALRRGLPVLTADRAWAALDLDLDIRLIR